ncbi:MAG: glucose-6-phosphate dehydrogenase [Candidatus Dadabacteria bacterium]|nr:MAG: glucose-6-phosphate dehydrogenase [Candidatus Dadabacteria bacterium]
MHNLFSEGESRIVRPPSTALVIFGASGDLTHRKLLPALYNLYCDDYLPVNFLIIGASRTRLSDQDFRDSARESVASYSRRELDSEKWAGFSKNMYYQPTDASKESDISELGKRIEALCQGCHRDFNYLYYLATAPRFFAPISANLKKAGLVEDPEQGMRRTSLIVEKPFGHDLESARELNAKLRQNFAESQIFRIDHYLGKETVQNILVFRFANGIFEPLWNNKYVDHIQISFAESIGVGSRASYFDRTGILRDVVQNHLFQILSLLCIEPPISLSDPDSIRDEKVKVLRSVRRLNKEEVAARVVRAQYDKGYINGEPVPGYLQEDGINSGSRAETYVAMRIEVDNWRWSGVPIYIRAGKRLPRRITEITVFFKRPPGMLFRGRQVYDLDYNVLAIQVQPEEGISLRISAKPPGPRLRVEPVIMNFTYGSSFGVPSPEAYERLLLDAMKGDATLFTRDDEIEEAWGILTPVLEVWKQDDAIPLYRYQAGSWGPLEADALLTASGHAWRKL